ncbi:MAG TPA: right-handed parallel beta-helix repeat-containing protein [Candidatus Hydrogenedentes bacterium]|nr:right-handed parallel beta-helix repeat-containing protein [Candidatus Hydrogenedentota bacterium]HQE81730.1 right-handed parallel beta-helix repeat-containing protein [Candidatus Hydrogenedentota bacterium]HQH51181.1 right-handed parallel beta-helix repeat-containing protein [Candidatus Hydrogenedentota bacterium]HQM50814.1 right-handed parallel beta-helix repeat-containing protein [Candidatus Hydrogenedentota bacterium]
MSPFYVSEHKALSDSGILRRTGWPAAGVIWAGLCIFAMALGARPALGEQKPGDGASSCQVNVAALLPEGFVVDGSQSYMLQLQQALDTAGETGGTVVFPPMTYRLDNAAGLRIHSNTTLIMDGARFVFTEDLKEDGQAFRGDGVMNVRFEGGTVAGKRESWDPGTNIAGVRLYGQCRNIHIAHMRFEDLSSNGVGIFGTDAEHPVEEIWIRDVATRNCCNYYGDYLAQAAGPAKGSSREDQGNITLYHAAKWVVEGCDLDGSQSDGTHFYHAHRGRFVNNRVTRSQMGGYFLEGCSYVLASDNLITENGSRGVTIERDSTFCTLIGNVVEHSGREGLWAPDVAGIVVVNNIFRENGRKDDADRDCEIRIDDRDEYATQTRDIRVTENLFYASGHQTAAVMITENVRDCIVRGNSLRGAAEGEPVSIAESSRETCVVEGNDTAAE